MTGTVVRCPSLAGVLGPMRPTTLPNVSYQRASTFRSGGSPDQSTTAANSSVRANDDLSGPTVVPVVGSYRYTPAIRAFTPVVWPGGSKYTNSTRPTARMNTATGAKPKRVRYSVWSWSYCTMAALSRIDWRRVVKKRRDVPHGTSGWGLRAW